MRTVSQASKTDGFISTELTILIVLAWVSIMCLLPAFLGPGNFQKPSKRRCHGRKPKTSLPKEKGSEGSGIPELDLDEHGRPCFFLRKG